MSMKLSARLTGSMRAAASRRSVLATQRASIAPVRHFSTPNTPKPDTAPPKESSGPYMGMFISVGALAAALAAYMYLGDDTKKEVLKRADHVSHGSGGAGGNGSKKGEDSGSYNPQGRPSHGNLPTKKDYQEVYNSIAEKLESPDYDDGSYGPVVLRLAWHVSGTFDKNTGNGGSNGATMRFDPEANYAANAGLGKARDFMRQFKKQYPWISYADLWTLGGVCAVQELGGPRIPWRPGRVDLSIESTPPDGRLPDGSQGAQHLRNIFHRMGFNDQEIVALAGAHALGRCHRDRSGFDGPWTFSPISVTNQYYTLLLDDSWKPRKWEGPFQYQDQSSKSLMMLPTDYSLIEDATFKKYVQKYADDEELWFNDFAKAFSTLLELGVPRDNFEKASKNLGAVTPLEFATGAEQENEQ